MTGPAVLANFGGVWIHERMRNLHVFVTVIGVLFCGCTSKKPSASPPTQTGSAPNAAAAKTAQKITSENCMDDIWLVTHYPVEKLAAHGLPAPCCVEGLLSEEQAWRCELDWPSSDVPPCSFWTEIHEKVAKATPEDTRNTLTRGNLATLARWVAEKQNCATEPAKN